MEDKDLSALKALAQAATPGLWNWDGRKVDEEGYVYIPECSYLVGGISLAYQHEDYQRDCDFIAAANPAAILSLIARVEQQAEEIAITDKLLAERNRVLQAIPGCEAHGDQCVPHALEWIAAKAAQPSSASVDLSGLTRYEPCVRGYIGAEVSGMEPAKRGNYVAFSDVQSLLATAHPSGAAHATQRKPVEFKRNLSRLCELLPAEFSWGDGLQASVLEEILDKYDAAQARQPAAAWITPERIESLIVWKGDPKDPYFDRMEFARAIEREVLAARVPKGILEQIAASWDGCMYDAPCETLDVGAELRSQFNEHGLLGTLYATPAASAPAQAWNGELPEPFFYYRANKDGSIEWGEDCCCQDDVYTNEGTAAEYETHGGKVYSEAQVRKAIGAALAGVRDKALEEAAHVCDWHSEDANYGPAISAARKCADAIRALKTNPASQEAVAAVDTEHSRRLMEESMPKRAAFIKYLEARSLDATEEKDAWGARIFKHTHIQAMWEGWFNAPTDAPTPHTGASVPQGFVLVPLKPTGEMIEAGNSVDDLYRMGKPELWGQVYRAMIAAAPAPSTQQEQGDSQ